MPEKCLESIHVHTGETLKRDLQDLAMLEGRAVGEYIRHTLELHVYGAKRRDVGEGATRSEGDRYGSR